VTLIAGALVLALLSASSCGGKQTSTTEPEDLSTPDKVRMAQSMMNAGRVGDALSLMDEALEGEPDNPGLWSFYGKFNFQAGKYDEAEKAFVKALEIDPYMTDAHNFLGAVYNEQGRPDEAEREFLIALKDPAYPSPQMVYLNLALLYGTQGRDEEAISNLRRAVEIDPKYYQAHFELASLLDRDGKIAEAAREYEVAAPAYRNVGDYHYRLGFVYFRLGEKAKARDSLERAIAVAPGSNSAAQADELLRMID
jgi:type IV pilus assembly protein PilF